MCISSSIAGLNSMLFFYSFFTSGTYLSYADSCPQPLTSFNRLDSFNPGQVSIVSGRYIKMTR